jgi:hypothetical protein
VSTSEQRVTFSMVTVDPKAAAILPMALTKVVQS